MSDTIKKIQQFLLRGVYPEITDFTEEEQNIFKKLKNFEFIEESIAKTHVREIIFHGPGLLEVISTHSRSYHSLHEDYSLIDVSFELLATKYHIDWNLNQGFRSFKAQIAGVFFRISLLHKSHGNKHHKYFMRKRENSTFDLSQFGFHYKEQLLSQNLIVCGSTGSGKTSFLNSLLIQNTDREHIILLEDTKEIQLPGEHVTHLHSETQLKQYCSTAMRLSPSRLVLGEMRSSEVIPFILLLTSGHPGLMSTIHANSAADAIERMALLFCLYSEKNINYQTLLELIAKNVGIVIFLKDKRVREVIEVRGHKNGHCLYENIGHHYLSEAT